MRHCGASDRGVGNGATLAAPPGVDGRVRALRWIFGSLVILTSLLVIAGGVALLVLDDAHWTAMVIRGVDVLAGDEYEVQGDFRASMQGGTTVSVAGLEIRSRAGDFSLVAASASVRLNLWALRHLTLLIEDLQLRDGTIVFTVADDAATGPAVRKRRGWGVLPVVGEALIERVAVTFENPAAETTVVDIARITLQDDAAVAMTRLQAYGTVDATAFSAAGSLGDVGALVAPPESGFPIDITLTSRAIEAHLSGTVARPISGKGVDLGVSVSAPSVDGLLDVWLPEGLSLGAMNGSARLRGEVRRLAADDVQLSLENHRGLTVDVHGALDDLLAMRGINLEYLVHIDDAALLQRVLPEGFEFVDRVVATGTVRGGGAVFDVDDLGFVMTSRFGDVARLDGAAGLTLASPSPRLQLTVQGEVERGAGVVRARRFNRFLHGLDSVQLEMVATFADAFVVLDSLRLELGRKTGALLTVTGAIDQLPFAEDQWFDGLDLRVEFEGADLTRVGELFDLQIPRGASARGGARISGSGRDTLVDDLALELQLLDAALKITGSAGLDFSAARVVDQIDLGLQGDTAELADVFPALGLATPALGAAELTGRVTGQGRRLDLVYLNLGVPALQASLETSGALDLGEAVAIELTSELKITEVATLLGAFSIDTRTSLGGLSGLMTMSGRIGDLSVENLTLTTTGPSPLTVDVSGVIDHWRPGAEPAMVGVAVDARVAAPSIAGLGAAFGIALPDLGAGEARVAINDLDASVGAESVIVRIVKDGVDVMRAEGRIDDLAHRSEIGWNVGFDLELSPLLAYATGVEAPDLGRVRADVELSDADGSLGLERVELSSADDQAVTIDAAGVVDDLVGGDEIEVQASVGIAEPALLGKVLGVDVVGAGPVRIDGAMVGSIEDHTMEARLSVGRTHATVVGRLRVEGGKPQVTVDTIIERFYPDDFGTFEVAAATDEAAGASADPAVLFSDEPFDLAFLDGFNLDLSVRVDEVVMSEAGGLDRIHVGVKLSDGELHVEPIRFDYAGGGLNGRFELTRSPETHLLLDLEGNDIYLGQVLAQIRQVSTIRGVATIDVYLEATGDSPQALVSSLDGRVGLVIEDGHLPRRIIDQATVDTFGWTVNATAARGRSQPLHCGIGRLDVSKGLITVEALYLDGPGLRVVGAGEVNLPEESLNLVFLPKRKRRLWAAADPVRLSGDLSSPEVTAVPAKAAMREIGTFALAGPVIFMSVRALGYLFGMVADEDAATSSCIMEPVSEGADDAPPDPQDIE